MSQHKKAAIISYINLAVTNISGILVTPFTISMLGDSEYGLYTLIGAFVGYLSVLDLGLNNAIVRFTALYRAEKNKIAEENFLAVSLIIYLVIGLSIAALGVILFAYTDVLFGNTLSPEQLNKAKLMIMILILNVSITIPGGAFAAICSGYENFVFTRILTLLKYIVRLMLVVVILMSGADSIGLVILDTIMNLAFIGCTVYFVFFKLKVKIKLHSFEWHYVREIFQYTFWIFIFGLVYQFQWRTGQVVLGSSYNTTIVAVYSVGVMLGIYFTNFGNVINGLLLPRAVQLIHRGVSDYDLTLQMIKVGRVSMYLLFFVFGAFLLTGQNFIELWVGKAYDDAWFIAILIMGLYIIPISQGFAHAILDARKLLKFNSLAFLIFSVAGTFLGAYLSKRFGSLGMISGLFLSLFLLQVVINFYYYKVAKLGMMLFIKKTYMIIMVPFLAIVLLCWYIFPYLGYGWPSFFLKNLIFGTLYMIAMYLFVMNTYEKDLIFGNILSLTRK